MTSCRVAQELGIRLSTSSSNPNSSHHQSVPVTSTPSSSQPVAAPPTVSSQPVAATPPVNRQPVIMTAIPPVSHQPVAATPPVNNQLVTATPPFNRQPVIMTAIPPVSHQPVAATSPVNNQLMTATPPVNHQPVTATPQLAADRSPTASSNDDLTVDGQLILSNGWLSRWKGRHGVFSVRLHGEAGGADQQGMARVQRELPGIIEKYRPEDVFNINETGLFYRQASDTPMIKVGSFDCFMLSNHLLLFFPANCTSVVQPLDQGVIAVLKARYKSKLATHMVTQYDIDPTQDLQALSSKTDVKEAIIWLHAAWGEITPSTIVNCWCKAGILPADWCRLLRPDRAAVAVAEATEGAQLTAITTAIQRLPVENGTTHMSATEWVNAPGEMEIEGAETIAQIAARLMGRDNEDRDDESDGEADPNNVEPRTVPLEEAKRSALSLAQFHSTGYIRIGQNTWTVGETVRTVGSKVFKRNILEPIFGAEWKTVLIEEEYGAQHEIFKKPGNVYPNVPTGENITDPLADEECAETESDFDSSDEEEEEERVDNVDEERVAVACIDEYWSLEDNGFKPAKRFKEKTGMSKNRWEEIRSALGFWEGNGDFIYEKEKEDEWYRVRKLFELWNENMDNSFIASDTMVCDECMCRWLADDFYGPSVTKMPLKPEGVGFLIKAAACGRSRIIFGDSWFASVPCAIELLKRGLYFTGIVKGRSSEFSKTFFHESAFDSDSKRGETRTLHSNTEYGAMMAHCWYEPGPDKPSKPAHSALPDQPWPRLRCLKNTAGVIVQHTLHISQTHISHSSDIDGVLQRAYNSGTEKIIITGGSLTDSREALQLASADERLYITVGCHPTRSQEFEQLQPGSSGDGYFQELLSIITSNPGKVVAIGECELDYDRLQFCPKEVQLKYFEKQLLLAEKTGLPLFLHCRNSFRDFIDVMKRNRAAFNGGVIHSFDGTLEEARDAVNFGLYIGLNVCSLKSAQNLDVVKSIPIESILLETDAPCSNYPAILEQLWCPICLMIMSQPLELGAAM
eukprot:Em0001g2693a